MSAASDIRRSWPACELFVVDPARGRTMSDFDDDDADYENFLTHSSACLDTPAASSETDGPSMHAARLWWQLHGTRAREAS